MNKKKVLFAAQNFSVGGVQKALLNQLCTLSESGEYDLHLFTFTGGSLLKELPRDVTVLSGGKLLRLSAESFGAVRASKKPIDILLRVLITAYARVFGSERFYRRCFKRLRYKEQFDAAVSYFTDVPAGAFNKGTNLFVSDFVDAAYKVAWIHTDPILSGFDKDYCRRIYAPFNKIICVSEGVRKKFLLLLPEYANKTEVRHNVFCKRDIEKKSREYLPFKKDGKVHIVTVARTDNASKRIDGIVRLCKRLCDDGVRNFCWHIVGDGPDRIKCEELAVSLSVTDNIRFEGEKENPYPYIQNADLFALYSAYEGFPLVIGEAILLKTPILTCRYAAAEEQIPPEHGEIADSDEDYYLRLRNFVTRHNQSIQPVKAVCIDSLTQSEVSRCVSDTKASD